MASRCRRSTGFGHLDGSHCPTLFIHEGELKGQGYEDVITDILMENMPQYSHKKITANISRHYYSFKQGEKVCNVGLYKTPEREAFIYFSTPSFFTLPTVLVIKKEKFADFGGSKTVRLDTLLQNKKITIGRAKNRSYGRYVDTILDRYKDQANVVTFEGEELSRNFFQMLGLNRIDALISLPEEAIYQAEKLGIKDEIMTLTIEENQVGYASWLSYVGCSKTDWGKKIIEQINRVLHVQRPTKRYRQAYERWLDESSLANYRRLYDQVFLKGSVAAE